MWCEYVNMLIKFEYYTLNLYGIPHYNEETDVLGIIFWTILTILTLIFFAWWIIPLRLILISHKFKCNKKL